MMALNSKVLLICSATVELLQAMSSEGWLVSPFYRHHITVVVDSLTLLPLLLYPSSFLIFFIVFSSFRRLDWAHISFYLLDRRNKLFLINISSIICLFDWLIDCVIDCKYWSKYHGIHRLIDPRPPSC